MLQNEYNARVHNKHKRKSQDVFCNNALIQGATHHFHRHGLWGQ